MLSAAGPERRTDSGSRLEARRCRGVPRRSTARCAGRARCPGWRARWRGSSRKNRWNSLLCSSSGMPMPVSLTRSCATSAPGVTSTSTLPPSGVNFTALLTRFERGPFEVGGVALEHHRLRGQVRPERPGPCVPRGRPRRWHAYGVAQVRRLLVECEAAVLHPRQREQVLDEVQETLAVALDPLDQLVLHLGEVHGVILGEELGVADDAGQRGPQLVADGRDELSLGAVELSIRWLVSRSLSRAKTRACSAARRSVTSRTTLR